MQPPWSHIAVVIYFTYNLSYLFLVSRWLHIFIAPIFLFMGLRPSRVTQRPKYSISVFPMKDFSILHLSPFSSVYLALIPTSVHDLSIIILLI